MANAKYTLLPDHEKGDWADDQPPPVYRSRRPSQQTWEPRSRLGRLLVLCVLGLTGSLIILWPVQLSTIRAAHCTADEYDAGSWHPVRDAGKTYNSTEDVLHALGYPSCKAQALGDYDFHGFVDTRKDWYREERLSRQISWAWRPGPTCRLKRISMKQKLQMLVDRPLLLAGDSRTRQHFVQLSCELSSHVTWHMDERLPSDPPGDAWRFKMQHLYIDPSSPLLDHLEGVQLAKPLVSYMPLYLPLSPEELEMLPGIKTSVVGQLLISHPGWEAVRRPLASTLEVWERYGVMVFSTGAHFYTTDGANDIDQADDLSKLLQASTAKLLRALRTRIRGDQRVMVQAITAGHGDCDRSTAPLTDLSSPVDGALPYSLFPRWNDILREEALAAGHEWLGMGRLSGLRPDAHFPGDCTHVTLGSGVYEAHSQYLWQRMAEK